MNPGYRVYPYVYIMTYLEMTPTDISDVSPGVIFTPLPQDHGLEMAVDQLSIALAKIAPAELPDGGEAEEQNEALQLPAVSGGVNTARIRTMLLLFISQLFAMFSLEHVQRGAAQRLKEIKQALRGLHKAEIQNYEAAVIASVQQNDELRAQIKEDLGGEDALMTWERRKARFDARIETECPAADVETDIHTEEKTEDQGFKGFPPSTPEWWKERQSARYKISGIITDRTGMFRLAPITAPRKASTPRRNGVSTSNPYMNFRGPKLIGLTPDQLRARAAQYVSGKVMSLKKLAKLWSEILADHERWGDHLMMADLQIGSRAIREVLAPP